MIRNRESLAGTRARELILDCFETGIVAGDPERLLPDVVGVDGDVLVIDEERINLEEFSEVIVLGGGKAAVRQAVALETVLGGHIDGGVVVTNGPAHGPNDIDVLPGDHPVPSEQGARSTDALLEMATAAGPDTLILVPISGGGSALLVAPAGNITVQDLAALNEQLLASGATIEEMNAVRKHVSRIKGGGLARAAAPARVVSLVMSDVIGDDLAVIASGPTAPDPTTFADAVAVLARYDIDAPTRVADHLQSGVAGAVDETPSAGESAFDRVSNYVIAGSDTAMRAAESVVLENGITCLPLSARIRGEAREAAKTQLAIGEEILASGRPIEPPCVILSGGETTVTLRGDGTGGPNHEFALSAAIDCEAGITLGAIDTDGIDGAAPTAGGLVDSSTVEDHRAAREALADNDSFPYLRDRHAVVETRQTGTNLNDFRVLVVED